jgi:LysM repeat protein
MRPLPDFERRRRPARFTVWTVVAPVALLLSVSVIVVIAREAGWVGTAPTATASKPTTTRRAPPRTGATGTAGTTSEPPKKTPTKAAKVLYTVQAGDTLEAIAIRFNTSVGELLRLNPGVDPQSLTVGQKLRRR